MVPVVGCGGPGYKWTGCIPVDLDDSGCMMGSATPIYSKQEKSHYYLCVQARVFPFSQVITSGIQTTYTVYLQHKIIYQALPNS